MERPSSFVVPDASTIQQPSAGALPEPSPELSNGINSRSCVTCRRRKVRCDKQQPCSNCASHRIRCEFPSSTRQKRKRRVDKPKEDVLLVQLKRLEGMVERISKDGGAGTPGGTADGEKSASPGGEARPSPAATDSQDSLLTDNFGRLLVDDDGKSRYGK